SDSVRQVHKRTAMLVLSRAIGQALVIDDQIVVTLESFSNVAAELSIRNTRGVPLGQQVLRMKERAMLPRDVEVVFFQTGPDRIRLGLTYEGANERIARKEFWDEQHGLG